MKVGDLYYEITDRKRWLAVPGPKKSRDVFEDYTEASRYVEGSWESGHGIPEPVIVRLVKKGGARRVAVKIVETIVRDLNDRRGLKTEWRAVSPEIQAEIKATWVAIVEKGMPA